MPRAATASDTKNRACSILHRSFVFEKLLQWNWLQLIALLQFASSLRPVGSLPAGHGGQRSIDLDVRLNQILLPQTTAAAPELCPDSGRP
eukprot:s3268_g4.t1